MIGPMPGGGLRVECLSMKTIIQWAYDVQDYQVTGGPSWAASERWNILAKPAAAEGPQEAPATYEKMTDVQRTQFMKLVRLRTQALLADRFQLTLRHETREQTAYALVVAKNGAKLKESANQADSGFMKRGRGQITARASQMEGLAKYLAIDVRRPVTDETHLTAHYDFTLEWTPDTAPAADSSARAAAEPSGPTLFTAIEEQLGLRLEAHKAPVETLVIERAEKPSNN